MADLSNRISAVPAQRAAEKLIKTGENVTNISTVTISGADDGVDQAALAQLSKEFPYVEWGVLHSASRRGTPRYPSERWLCELIQLSGYRSLRLSAHLCGKLAHDVLFGAPGWTIPDPRAWQRVQLNGFSTDAVYAQAMDLHDRLYPCWGTEFIYQCADARAAEVAATIIAGHYGRGAILLDASGGRGMRAPEIIWASAKSAKLGYAGGITPDNVAEICTRVAAYPGKIWIDMESGVRTDDRFDLEKVRRVLEVCRPYVAMEAR